MRKPAGVSGFVPTLRDANPESKKEGAAVDGHSAILGRFVSLGDKNAERVVQSFHDYDGTAPHLRQIVNNRRNVS